MGIGASGLALYMDVRTTCLMLALTACSHPMVAVRGDEMMKHLDELGRAGSAHVETVRTDGGASDAETVFLSQTVTFDDASAALQNVVEGCGPFAGLRPCRIRNTSLILLRDLDAAARDRAHYGDPIVQDRPPTGQSESAANKAVAATFFFGGLAGTGLCIVLCGDHKVAGSIAFASGGLVAAVVWAVLSGAHD